MVNLRNYGVGTGYTSSGITGKKSIFSKDEKIYAVHVWDDLKGGEVFKIEWQRLEAGTYKTIVTSTWTNPAYSSAYQWAWIKGYPAGKWRCRFLLNNIFGGGTEFTITEEEIPTPPTPPAPPATKNFDPSLPYTYMEADKRIWQYFADEDKWYVYNHGKPEISDLIVTASQWEALTKEVPPAPPVKSDVNFITHPSGANLFIDGVLKGKTNLVVKADAGSEHSYKIELEGYETIEASQYWPSVGMVVREMTLAIIKVPPPVEETWWQKLIKIADWIIDFPKLIGLAPGAKALRKLWDSIDEATNIERMNPDIDIRLNVFPWWFAMPESAITAGVGKFGLDATNSARVTKVIKNDSWIKSLEWMKANRVKTAKAFPKLNDATKAQLLKSLGKDRLAKSFIRELELANHAYMKSIGTPTLIKVLDAIKKPKTILWGLAGMLGLVSTAYGITFGTEWFAKEGLFELYFIPLTDKMRDYRREPTPEKLEAIKRDLAKLREVIPGAQALIKGIAWLWPFTKDAWLEYADGMEFEVKAIEDELAALVPPIAKGLLTIRPTPSDAKVSVEGQIPTTGIFSAELPIGSYDYVISKFGYTSKSGTIELTEEGKEISVEIEKEVVPPEELEENLTISVAPDETKIFISGHPEITKEGTYTLPLGPYTIYFSLEGYRDHTAYATLKAGKPITVSHSMIKEEEPEPEKAELLITSKPSFADVMIDGKSTFQKTPYTAFLDEGWHTIRVELSDYEPEEEDIELVWGDEKTKEFTLNKVPPTKGTLRIESDPPGAHVYIDGESKYATTPYTITLLAETYKIRLTKDGYLPVEEDVVVKAGEEITESYPLSKEPITDARITIASEPPDADIYIDGEYQYAKTPFTKLFKPATYTVRVQKDGYYPETSYIEFEEGEDSTVTFTLTEIPAPEIPPDPYIPQEPYYPEYVPAEPYVPTYIPTPPAELPVYDYPKLYPETISIPAPAPVSKPVEKELLINIETTDVKPWKGRIYSIAILDLTDPAAEILVSINDNEQLLIEEFLSIFNTIDPAKLVGFKLIFDYRYIFAKMMLYRIQNKKFYNVGLRDVKQILDQVKEEFVYYPDKTGKLDDYGKMLLGVGKYGSQELMLRKYISGDFDYVREFQNRQIELTRDLYNLARFSMSEAFISSPSPATSPISTPELPETTEMPVSTQQGQCPICFSYVDKATGKCPICEPVI